MITVLPDTFNMLERILVFVVHTRLLCLCCCERNMGHRVGKLSHIEYVCVALEAVHEHGWPAGRLHSECFWAGS